MRIKLFVLLCFCYAHSHAQSDYEYVGVIKLNDSALISYKITFIEKAGLITGNSITDLGGAHETKSFISGYFDDKDNKFDFYESGILYTKSPITQDDFCYIHFTGKLKKLNERQQITGTFKGLYDNGEECINGEISLGGFEKILRRASKLDKKIDRSLVISKEKKDKVNLVRSLDTLSMNIITQAETLSIFTKDSNIKLGIYDAGKEDGDRINLIIDGKLVLENYTVTKKIRNIEIPITSEPCKIQVEAINVGSSAPNTVRIEITDTQNFIRTLTNLDAGEKAGVTIIHK